jgi:hypothetical protein
MYYIVLVVISDKEGNSRRKQEKHVSRDQIRMSITKKKGILIQNIINFVLNFSNHFESP